MNKHIAALLLSVMGSAAFAGPDEYLFSPIVEQGEKEIDMKLGRAQSGHEVESAGTLGFGTTVAPRWFFEAYGVWEKPVSADYEFKGFEFESKYQLTETGEYPIDLGVIAELEIPRDHKAQREFVLGPLLQTETGRMQYNLNVLLERTFGGELDPGEHRDTVLRYQGQIKYRQQPEFEFGVQAFGEVGKWNDWASRKEQTHKIGPAVFGKISVGERRFLVYNAAWLFGATDASPDNTLRAQIEFEF